MVTYKDEKVGGGISRSILVDNEEKGSIYLSNRPCELGYQVTTIDRPYKARYFKTLKGAERYIIRNGKKFMSLVKALNNSFGCDYVKQG